MSEEEIGKTYIHGKTEGLKFLLGLDHIKPELRKYYVGGFLESMVSFLKKEK